MKRWVEKGVRTMPGRDERGRGDRRPPPQGPGRPPGGPEGGAKPRGGLGLSRLREGEFELVHPRCVLERRPDYEEGMELWTAGDVEAARDALRYALEGCGDNLWVHVALGRIALQEDKDPTLARGHFGYAFELVERALPRGFAGVLPRSLATNRPCYEAADGLATCYEALGRPREAADLRARAVALAGGERSPGRGQGPGRSPG